MPSMFDRATRENLIQRIRALTPDAPRAWGRMTAPEMIAHLTDQMSHTLGDVPTTPIRDFRRWPELRERIMYVLLVSAAPLDLWQFYKHSSWIYGLACVGPESVVIQSQLWWSG